VSHSPAAGVVSLPPPLGSKGLSFLSLQDLHCPIFRLGAPRLPPTSRAQKSATDGNGAGLQNPVIQFFASFLLHQFNCNVFGASTRLRCLIFWSGLLHTVLQIEVIFSRRGNHDCWFLAISLGCSFVVQSAGDLQEQLNEMSKKQMRLERLVDTMLKQRQADEKERETLRQLDKNRETETQRNAARLLQQQQQQQQPQQQGKVADVRTGRSNAARDVKPAASLANLNLDLEKVATGASTFPHLFQRPPQFALICHCRCMIRGALTPPHVTVQRSPHGGPSTLLRKSRRANRAASRIAAHARTFQMGGRVAAQRSSWSSSSARQVISHLRACNSPARIHAVAFPEISGLFAADRFRAFLKRSNARKPGWL